METLKIKSVSDLISDEYRELNKELHKKAYGTNSCLIQFPGSVLDYGCGKGFLSKKMKVTNYDPCVEEFSSLPEPHDHVICADVLEHVEPDKLDNVLAHIKSLMKVSGYVLVCTRPAKKSLKDGRNAHISLHSSEWWIEKLNETFKFTPDRTGEWVGGEIK